MFQVSLPMEAFHERLDRKAASILLYIVTMFSTKGDGLRSAIQHPKINDFLQNNI